ncbi:MAG: uroporphyrinogen decarboxylase [Clostridia bacterium]|nr:uroporphyrinogen decarboxylase [Clostridia bacterium]
MGNDAPANQRFLRACRGEATDCTPVWFMRQAGRYQPEYRALRERYSLLDLCENPDLCVEVTMLPVRQLGVDAAILFSDITVPLRGVGIPIRLVEHVGPVLDPPLHNARAVAAIRPLVPEEDVPFVLEAIRQLRRQLHVPLIGFAGGPFTLASYLVEGGGSRHFTRTKHLMYSETSVWNDLMTRLTDIVTCFLRAQVEAGAQALQVFDSWVGSLAPEDYAQYVLPHSRRLFDALADLGVPRIHFGVGTATLLELMREAGGDVMGIDWRIPLGEARRRLGPGVPLQGNLDPAVLLGPWEVVASRARSVLAQAGDGRGHVFNLGHGVLPETPVDHLRRLVALVHEESRRPLSAGATDPERRERDR